VRLILAKAPRCDRWSDDVVDVLVATADPNGIVDRAHAKLLRACAEVALAKVTPNTAAAASNGSGATRHMEPAGGAMLLQLDAPLRDALLAFREHDRQHKARTTWTITQDALLLHQ